MRMEVEREHFANILRARAPSAKQKNPRRPESPFAATGAIYIHGDLIIFPRLLQRSPGPWKSRYTGGVEETVRRRVAAICHSAFRCATQSD